MAKIIITPQQFRSAFPEFAADKFPDALITRFLTMSQGWISHNDGGCVLTTDERTLLIELLVAHLITLYYPNGTATETPTGGETSVGGTTGVVKSSSIGDVSVSMQDLIANTAFEQWIQSTGYGQQYWTMLQAKTPTPIYFPGAPRSPYGIR